MMICYWTIKTQINLYHNLEFQMEKEEKELILFINFKIINKKNMRMRYHIYMQKNTSWKAMVAIISPPCLSSP